MSKASPAAGTQLPPANVLFDLDGTLIDSSSLHDRAFRAAFAAAAPALAQGFDYHQHKGRPTPEVFGRLGVADAGRRDELTALKQAHYRAAVANGELGLFEGARELLSALKAAGIGLFLVTGSSAASAAAALRAGGVDHLLTARITAEDAPRGKPAPDAYLECLRRHGLAADDCVAVEDAVDGVEAARDAGLRVFGVHDATITALCDDWAASLPLLGARLHVGDVASSPR